MFVVSIFRFRMYLYFPYFPSVLSVGTFRLCFSFVFSAGVIRFRLHFPSVFSYVISVCNCRVEVFP